MATRAEKVANLKKDYPTLKSGSDETGYTDFSAEEYEATISKWADNQLADEAKAAEVEQAIIDKAALLARMGLTDDEAKLLLS